MSSLLLCVPNLNLVVKFLMSLCTRDLASVTDCPYPLSVQTQGVKTPCQGAA
jgi:hypothetical protein